jgi:hypothetical protein
LVCQQLKTLRAAETHYCPGISAQIPPPTTPKCLVNRSPPRQNTEREPSQVQVYGSGPDGAREATFASRRGADLGGGTVEPLP